MKLFFLILIGTIFNPVHTQTVPAKLDEESISRIRVEQAILESPLLKKAFDQAKESKKLLLINVGAFWCGPCHILKENLQKPELNDILSKNFVQTKIDLSLIQDEFESCYTVSYRDALDGDGQIQQFDLYGENCNPNFNLNALIKELELKDQLDQQPDLEIIDNDLYNRLFEELSQLWEEEDLIKYLPTVIVINPKNIDSLSQSSRKDVYIQRIDAELSINNLTSIVCLPNSKSIECFLSWSIEFFKED